MKYAVLITAHNEEAYIGAALKALDAQTVPRSSFDVVVVDNASTDRTAQIAKDGGAVVISEPKKGIPFALKAGYDYVFSQGYEWVLQTDADSQVSPLWVESFVTRAEKNDVVGVTGPVYFNDIPSVLKFLTLSGYKAFVLLQAYIVGYYQFTGSNMAMNMSAYQSIGGIDTSYLISADVDLSRRLAKIGKIAYVSAMSVGVSSRRIRKQPLRALKMYAKGLYSAIRGKSSTIELDDVR
ncbi:hypothetical protein CO180_00015 [candidate division WWE3 bacterium CG_4_9_14_3_um_filter_41_6]|uniref:Glycosyltransferase 2-like domain-containing protein n=1 Tax=candidate division WWE3 bacterium CG_4_10_14_0_2_um_filter_41_14 TaxID=1975072 RepID=A0A2M7TIX8_UNCKA|nr:MAG: hypothetical protein COY32_04165 [candidate division WWE3 bacterium CG_4_10_14_0_2_um_filter_41_14]PJA39731.1 MAG: hypothetical protein CO180_00015 [candidate division WWE3 bacterium CG_4_9_14_3_um_filter_41_6]